MNKFSIGSFLNYFINKAVRISAEHKKLKNTCEAKDVQLQIFKRHAYYAALSACLSSSQRLRIAIVGANDGLVNDPIYQWIRENPESTVAILIEPQSKLHSALQFNYKFHPCAHILNCGIGPEGTSQLYSVKQEYWLDYQPSYASEWPLYRAPLGLSSISREHIEKHLLGYMKDSDVMKAIEAESIEFFPLDKALIRQGLPPRVDILQIDAEGYDDIVLYNSSLSVCAPIIVYVEVAHIAQDRRNLLRDYLLGHGYEVYDIDGDWLCVKSLRFSKNHSTLL